MPLPPFLRRKTPAAAPPAPEGSPEVARTRARRRLIGALLLLGVGVIAFPLLFETEPRPIPVDLPIIVPSKDGAPPLAMPGGSGQVGGAGAVAGGASRPGLGASRPPLPMITESPTDPAPSPAVVAASGAASSTAAVGAPPKSGSSTGTAPGAAVVSSTPPSNAPTAAARAAASAPRPVAAKPPAATPGPQAAPSPSGAAPSPPAAASAPGTAERYVVQIGAFAEDKTVREVRAKAAKAGLDTFTQVVTVEAGTRTRVRIGPFPRRQDAEAAAAKAKKAGLPASVLKL